MSPGRLALGLCTLAWLAGCGQLATLRGSGPDGVGELLRYEQMVADLPQVDVATHRRAAERDLAAHDTPAARLRLALILGHGAASRGDAERARELLAPLEDGSQPAAPEYVALARHLLRAWQHEARHRAQASELEELRVHNATLEKQLQAIRSIEQQLERRDTPPRPAR